jgi:hypothetical protein
VVIMWNIRQVLGSSISTMFKALLVLLVELGIVGS